jgi:hypothetical protein
MFPMETTCSLLVILLSQPSRVKIDVTLVNFYWTAWHHILENSVFIVTAIRI